MVSDDRITPGMDAMKQLDMFGFDARPAPPPLPPRSQYTHYPEELVKRLGATLRLAERAQFRPWAEWETKTEIKLFHECVERLPPEYRGDLADRFRAQMTRLGLSESA